MVRGVAYLGAFFILLPSLAILASSVSEMRFVSFPPQGFTLTWFAVALGRVEFLDSFRISVIVATLASIGASILGVITSLALRNLPPALHGLASAVVMSPLVLPGVVIGIALLQFFSLADLDVSLASLVLGHIVITVPYVVRLVSDSLAALPRNLRWAAASLGASPLRIVTAVVLPCIKPAIIGGSIFAFIVSFENVTISIFLASPRLTTLPVRVFGYTEQAVETWLVAVCSLTILFTLALILVIERIVGVRQVVHAGKA